MRCTQAFPAAEAGQTRFIVAMPAVNDPSGLMVELQVGKTVEVDSVNSFFFAGELVPTEVTGWGFTRYVLPTLGPMAGTRMAPDPSHPLVSKFVQIGGEPKLLPYNNNLPYVVYVPNGVEVRYKFWRADAHTKFAVRG